MIKILARDKALLTIPSINFPFIHIDISDYPEEHIEYNNPNLIDKLNLEFFDLSPEDLRNSKFLQFKDRLFSKEQAIQVVRFLIKYKSYPLIVNCYKGVSRSAAIGKFGGIMKGENISWINPPAYSPNPHILKLLYENQNL